MEFWRRVKELLKSQKTTQEKLCKSCDISLSTFVSWIHNERLPDLTSALMIAKALGTTVEYLVAGEEPEPVYRIPDDLMDVMKKYVLKKAPAK